MIFREELLSVNGLIYPSLSSYLTCAYSCLVCWLCFQDPNEDTEWNDILRKKGIIPEKEKKVEDDDILFAAHEIKQAQMASKSNYCIKYSFNLAKKNP